MEVVILIFINVLMAAVFYVILRFKLEKYASDYRERRLKREMDEIIYEFNETAERNITLLENKLELMRKLLEKTNGITNIDLSIDDNTLVKNSGAAELITHGSGEFLNNYENNTNKYTLKKESAESGLISKYFIRVKDTIEKKYKTIINHKHHESVLTYDKNASLDIGNSFDNMIKVQSEIITKSVQTRIIENADEENAEIRIQLSQKPDDFSENELEEMFSASADKYLLISDLHNKGYTSEVISRCSGIPIGEIKLVLDLNKSL